MGKAGEVRLIAGGRGRGVGAGRFPFLQPVGGGLARLIGLVADGSLGVPAPGQQAEGEDRGGQKPACYCRLPSHLLFSGWAPLSGQVATGARSWAWVSTNTKIALFP